jgi:predicted PurR-regulated permease PerM
MRRLSPLDDEHEKELIQEFERVSRAVVVATLSAALVQGLLAGFGFYIAGLDNVFLLSMLTVCFAMIPFFGAASIWLPCCIWLAFVENRLGAAIGLGIYGAVIVSLADNIIKPYVLHGQSNIHPLVALLSVLGGVGALGPIGILIGPMVVAFLQTLLKILQRELTQMEQVPESLATGSGATAISVAAEKRPILSGKKKKN